MKIGLLSDIHGNVDALVAVLKSASKKGIDRFLVAGDYVGYYFFANEVFAELDKVLWDGVIGNHDKMISEVLINDTYVNDLKYGIGLRFSLERLEEKKLKRLACLPETLDMEINNRSIHVCHGSPNNCNAYVYPDTEMEIIDDIFQLDYDLVVLGHTHYPVIWKNGAQYICNPGSVGQTRDRKPGACWAIWDSEMNQIELHRESYDSEKLLDYCKKLDPKNKYIQDVLTRT